MPRTTDHAESGQYRFVPYLGPPAERRAGGEPARKSARDGEGSARQEREIYARTPDGEEYNRNREAGVETTEMTVDSQGDAAAHYQGPAIESQSNDETNSIETNPHAKTHIVPNVLGRNYSAIASSASNHQPSRLEPLYKAANYVDATPAQKTAAIHSLITANFYSAAKLCSLTTLHDGISENETAVAGNPRKKGTRLKADFLNHNCTETCLLTIEAASESKMNTSPLSDQAFAKAAKDLKLSLGRTARTGEKRKRPEETPQGHTQKRKKTCRDSGLAEGNAPGATEETRAQRFDPGNTEEKGAQAFELISEEEKKQMIEEFIEATSSETFALSWP
ncbi:hypothetical protein K438DRAFT_1785478 [Mycena galopus ATCC 62051]|nr:hypothetical protein K438DRAFT_1785478 [Mycena galopus ATCC 62051]